MKIPVNRELRDRIADFVSTGHSRALDRRESLAFEQVLPDVKHFHAQMMAFRENSIAPYVAVLYDEDDEKRTRGLNVPIQADDLNDARRSYSRAIDVVEQSGIELKEVDSSEALEAFVERLAEAMAQMFANSYLQMGGPPVLGNKATTVCSNRANDTILCAKGYFLSTGTAFGVSTPAYGYLVPSRYCFGIMEPGGPRFENVLWSCPTTVRLRLP